MSDPDITCASRVKFCEPNSTTKNQEVNVMNVMNVPFIRCLQKIIWIYSNTLSLTFLSQHRASSFALRPPGAWSPPSQCLGDRGRCGFCWIIAEKKTCLSFFLNEKSHQTDRVFDELFIYHWFQYIQYTYICIYLYTYANTFGRLVE